ncbi:FkbM family methyltransferase [Candidatus Saccharibacteria bacterium]|nr:FkbM family methyltransferase [Candidatus Saccharibacteria bacterium]
MRNRFFERLSGYKRVDSLGAYKHNVDFEVPPYNPLDEKAWSTYLDLLSTYKFIICFENQSVDYYLTEKLYNALEAGSVPIYWGCPHADELYNSSAFLQLKEESTGAMSALIELIKHLDTNDAAYNAMLQAPPLLDCAKADEDFKNRISLIRTAVETPAVRLVSQIKILRDNAVYRIGDVVYARGYRWEQDRQTILTDDQYKGTILRQYLERLPAKSAPDFALLAEVVNNMQHARPAEDELVIHMRAGDVAQFDWFLTQDYASIIRTQHGIKKVTFVTAMHYGNFVERNLWLYTDESRDRNHSAFIKVFEAIHKEFPNLKMEIRSREHPDEDFYYLCMARWVSFDRGGFADCARAVRTAIADIPAKQASYAQLHQDRDVLEYLKDKRNGYFVDVGALDGKHISNTYLLEKEYGWTGLCCEANPTTFKKLVKTRSCACIDGAMYSIDGLELEFTCADALSGITTHQDTPNVAHQQKIAAGSKIKVRTRTLTSVLDSCGAPAHIDYLSIDTEGSEMEILQGIDFTRYTFGFIDLEHNYVQPRRQQMHLFLKSKGYRHYKANQWDDYYVRDSLHEIGMRHATDKFNDRHSYMGESYLHIYDRYFRPIRHKVRAILEIGVLNGCSLRTWREYFPNAHIYGIDINPSCKSHEGDRITVFIGDQNDPKFLQRVRDQIGLVDIILDDGSHITRHQIQSHQILAPMAKHYYIIEDLRCSYEQHLNHHDVRSIWPGMRHNDPADPLKNYRSEFVDFVQEGVKAMDFHTLNNRIKSITHHPMIVVFELIPPTIRAPKCMFTTFGNERFKHSRERIICEAQKTGLFSDTRLFTEKDLGEFGVKHGPFMRQNKRGYGYYIWKPYVIHQMLNSMADDDILVYCDAGCEIRAEHRERLVDYLRIVESSSYGFLTFRTPHKMFHYTKADLGKAMNISDAIWNDNIHVAGILIIRKCRHSFEMVEEWLKWATTDYHYIDDSPSVIANHPQFKEHRHDQSILNIILHKRKTAIVPFNETHVPNNGPLSASRIRI